MELETVAGHPFAYASDKKKIINLLWRKKIFCVDLTQLLIFNT